MRHARALFERYPGLAVVAGASEGIGAAFARRLAAEGFDLLIIARRPGPLEALAEEVRRATGQDVTTLPCDLASPDAAAEIAEEIGERRVGVLVYNAASAPAGRFLEQAPETLETLVRVNMAAPLLLLRTLLAPASGEGPGDQRGPGRRGVILMSSMAGWQGTSHLAGYSASKSFLRVLGEALWAELKTDGVDVAVSVPGATDTPGYRAQSGVPLRSVMVLDPERVAASGLRALGRRPLSIPGLLYKASALAMNRLMPRRAAIRIMSMAGSGLNRSRRAARS